MTLLILVTPIVVRSIKNKKKMDNKITVLGVCLGCREIKSKKSGTVYYILQFYVDKEKGELIELLHNSPISESDVSSFNDLAKGDAKVGTVTFEQSVYQRRMSLRFVSFVKAA